MASSVTAAYAGITSEQVEEQVLQFYGSGGGLSVASGAVTASGRDTWLTTAQSSPSAWQFAFELVNLAKKPEVQFFGANTLGIQH